MLSLIIDVAKNDPNIKAVMLNGSRADPSTVPDIYQDYDIVYFTDSVKPYWGNKKWLEEKFGRLLLLQTPETMTLIPPDGKGDFVYLAIFDDGVRIDLTLTERPYDKNGEPAIVLLDKEGILSDVMPDPGYYNVKKPSQKEFSDCCNEFWWCLNNVAKGIMREEHVYTLDMMNRYVRDMLNKMASWYIGADSDFSVSPGKSGKNFGKYLEPGIYNMYLKTYAQPDRILTAAIRMMDLFSLLAKSVAGVLDYKYNQSEEDGLRAYYAMTVTDRFEDVP